MFRGILQQLLFFGCAFFLFACDGMEVADKKGVSGFRALEQERGIEIAGYEFDFPKGYKKSASLGYDKEDNPVALVFERSPDNEFVLRGARFVSLQVLAQPCGNRMSLANARQRNAISKGFKRGQALDLRVERVLNYETFQVASESTVLLEQIFERPRGLENCLVMSTKIEKSSERFHGTNLGDLDDVLRTVIGSLRFD